MRKQFLVICYILIGEGDKTQETHDIDIGFRRVERDQFRAFADAE
jgi:hypothetical protein